MSKNKLYLINLIVLLLPLAPAYGSEPDSEIVGWTEDRDIALGNITTIAIFPTQLNVTTPNDERAAAVIEAHIDSYLKKLNINLISADVYQGILHDTKVSLGGYYDTYTGEILEDKYKSIHDLARREFDRLHDYQAIFRTVVTVLTVRFIADKATWHGVTENVTGKDARFGMVSGGLGYATGSLPAISLVGVLSANDDTKYYVHAGGIQLHDQIKSGNKFTQVPQELLLADETKLSNAVDILMTPLVTPTLTEQAKKLREQEAKEKRRQEKRARRAKK